jgi:3-hydroxy-9,10-secoandrosta-1,3,5(10)-triene-9,17-dione monooxygenase
VTGIDTSHGEVMPSHIGADSPDVEDLVARARQLRPLLAEHAAEAEESRRISPVVIGAIRDAELFRLTVPRRHGGFELPWRAVVEICSIISEGCGSAGWVTGYANTAKWMASLWSAEAQEEFFAAGPDAIHAGSSKPTTDVETVDGGYVISGTWPSLSGVPYASWVGVFMLVSGGDGRPPMMKEALVPVDEVRIVDTWSVPGLKATGSESVVAERVFVPEHRTIDMSLLQSNDFHLYPTPFKEEALYRAATHPILALAICLTPLGLAQGALDLVVEGSSDRALTGTTFAHQRDSTSFQNEISDAAMSLDTARLHVYRAAEDIDRFAQAGEVMDFVSRARVRGDTGWAMRHATACIDRIMTAVGSGAFSLSSPLQRMWRDANVAARHGAANPMLSRETYGKALLGLPVEFNRLTV